MSLKQLKIELPCDLAIPLLGIFQKKIKMQIQKDIFNLCLCQHYLQQSEYKNNLSRRCHTRTHVHTHTHTEEYYPAIKIEILPLATIWLDLEVNMQRQILYNFIMQHACSVASVVSDFLLPHGLQPTRLLCPWDSPGQNTGMGCHFLLQGIFPTQGLNPDLLHCKQILYCLSHWGSSLYVESKTKIRISQTQGVHLWQPEVGIKDGEKG